METMETFSALVPGDGRWGGREGLACLSRGLGPLGRAACRLAVRTGPSKPESLGPSWPLLASPGRWWQAVGAALAGPMPKRVDEWRAMPLRWGRSKKNRLHTPPANATSVFSFSREMGSTTGDSGPRATT